MDRLSAMTSFVRVVEDGGFSAAARRLNISTSVVTTHIKSIEDRLGVLLLNRSTRKVSLTEVGQVYYERCVQILSEIDDAEQFAESSQMKPRGILRLNVAEAIPPVLAAPLAEFGALYPDASVRVTVTSRMVDLIEEGFDLAIRVIPVSDASLIVRRLASYRFVVCGAPSYIARRGRPERPAELAEHNCLVFYDSPWGKEWRFSEPEGEQVIRVSGNLQTNNVVALRSAAILGQGLIFAPLFMVAADLKAGALVPILTSFSTAESSVDAIYPNRRYLAAKVRSFIDLAARHFHEATWSDPEGLHSA
ncbi:MAG TPA: LysR family transcriptional regulator [Xanthobacteraceae bacterium]|jgi:DNA-binding transcriptional LysR family regulator